MREAVVVATVHDPADVHGVHAAEGHSRWTCLARRAGLHGGWEAVEWAWLPPGGVSGEHLHSRTEEVYFIADGRGEVTLDGAPRPVRAGSAVLTGAGHRHALRNTGDRPLSWLVVELPVEKGPFMSRTATTTVITDLRRTGPVDASTVLTGPLRTVEVTRLPPGAAAGLNADGVEHTVFVTDGDGTARTGTTTVPLAPGTALTLPLGTTAHLTAGDHGLECFHAVLAVPRGAPT